MSQPLPTTIIEYWRSQRLLINLGDYITELLARRFGLAPVLYNQEAAGNRIKAEDRCLLMVGSLIDSNWLTQIRIPKDIWGCGYWGDSRLHPGLLQQCTFHAVRGPLTRDHLGLPADIPLGDPALLLSTLWPLERKPAVNQILYIPHFNGRDLLDDRALERLGATKFEDIACLRSEFWDRIQSIVDSEFILTSSLHGAIIAQSYGRPWALCCPPGTRQDKPMKWADWFAYLGIEGKSCATLDEALKWWETQGSKGRIRDLAPLIQSFPISNGVAQEICTYLSYSV